MTETIIAKSLLGIASVPIMIIAAIDPSIQGSLVNVLSLLITTLGLIITSWIAYKQALLKKTVDVLKENTNGLKEELINATAKENLATGKMMGVAQAENKAAVIAAAKAEGVASQLVATKVEVQNSSANPVPVQEFK